MGVAGLFAFLRRKYPLIVEPCEQQPSAAASGHGAESGDGDGGGQPSGDTMCDNLYIDMNHIIHACTHPGWRDVPHDSEQEMFQEMEIYLDRLVGIARPTQLVFVAMDGVAPQAKMNQQRGRRFYAAHVEGLRQELEGQVRHEMASSMAGSGGSPAAAIPPLPAFNGNVITPGTAFMDRLSQHLRAFLARRLGGEPGDTDGGGRGSTWSRLLVLFSDSSEPGEGEQKIMRFVRHQRLQASYCPNTRHLIYGQDADLILLGLLTHEPHFAILRESEAMSLETSESPEAAAPLTPEEAAEERCQVAGGDEEWEGAAQAGDSGDDDDGEGPPEEGEGEADAFWTRVGEQPLHLLRLSTLREYLRFEFQDFLAPRKPPEEEQGRDEKEEQGEIDLITGERRKPNPNHGGSRHARGGAGGSGTAGGAIHSLERIIDDVVLLTFLAGNDFLPHVPSLDIYDRPSALQTLINKYKELLSSKGAGKGYLVSAGRVDGEKLRWVLEKLAAAEQQTFREREVRKQREAARKMREQQERREQAAGGSGGGGKEPWGRDKRDAGAWLGGGEWVSVGELAPGADLDAALNATPSAGNEAGGESGGPALAAATPSQLRRELLARVRDRLHDWQMGGATADPVLLALPGYRERYYDKYLVGEGEEREKVVRKACVEYIRGLSWVIRYYCCGTYPSPPPTSLGLASTPGTGRGYGDTPYAAWNWHYPYHYAPFASDLVQHVREGLKEGRGAAASAPVLPFVQLMCVLPLSSFEECLPPLLAKAALDPSTGLLAPQPPSTATRKKFGARKDSSTYDDDDSSSGSSSGSGSGSSDAEQENGMGEATVEAGATGGGGATGASDAFPVNVGALVDMGGKKWAHTAVLRLPFPDVSSISAFACRQLGSLDCHLTPAERGRNLPRPALLLCHAGHPLAGSIARCGAGALAAPAVPDVAAGEGALSALGGRTVCDIGSQPEVCPSGGGQASNHGSSNAEVTRIAAAPPGSCPRASFAPNSDTPSSPADCALPTDAAASILPLLLPRPPSLECHTAGKGNDDCDALPVAAVLPPELGEGVVAARVDIAGQHTPPFSPGLLPGTQEPEPVVSEKVWNTQLLQKQRHQLEQVRRQAGFAGGSMPSMPSVARGQAVATAAAAGFEVGGGGGGRGSDSCRQLPRGGGPLAPPGMGARGFAAAGSTVRGRRGGGLGGRGEGGTLQGRGYAGPLGIDAPGSRAYHAGGGVWAPPLLGFVAAGPAGQGYSGRPPPQTMHSTAGRGGYAPRSGEYAPHSSGQGYPGRGPYSQPISTGRARGGYMPPPPTLGAVLPASSREMFMPTSPGSYLPPALGNYLPTSPQGSYSPAHRPGAGAGCVPLSPTGRQLAPPLHRDRGQHNGDIYGYGAGSPPDWWTIDSTTSRGSHPSHSGWGVVPPSPPSRKNHPPITDHYQHLQQPRPPPQQQQQPHHQRYQPGEDGWVTVLPSRPAPYRPPYSSAGRDPGRTPDAAATPHGMYPQIPIFTSSSGGWSHTVGSPGGWTTPASPTRPIMPNLSSHRADRDQRWQGGGSDWGGAAITASSSLCHSWQDQPHSQQQTQRHAQQQMRGALAAPPGFEAAVGHCSASQQKLAGQRHDAGMLQHPRAARQWWPAMPAWLGPTPLQTISTEQGATPGWGLPAAAAAQPAQAPIGLSPLERPPAPALGRGAHRAASPAAELATILLLPQLPAPALAPASCMPDSILLLPSPQLGQGEPHTSSSLPISSPTARSGGGKYRPWLTESAATARSAVSHGDAGTAQEQQPPEMKVPLVPASAPGQQPVAEPAVQPTATVAAAEQPLAPSAPARPPASQAVNLFGAAVGARVLPEQHPAASVSEEASLQHPRGCTALSGAPPLLAITSGETDHCPHTTAAGSAADPATAAAAAGAAAAEEEEALPWLASAASAAPAIPLPSAAPAEVAAAPPAAAPAAALPAVTEKQQYKPSLGACMGDAQAQLLRLATPSPGVVQGQHDCLAPPASPCAANVSQPTEGSTTDEAGDENGGSLWAALLQEGSDGTDLATSIADAPSAPPLAARHSSLDSIAAPAPAPAAASPCRAGVSLLTEANIAGGAAAEGPGGLVWAALLQDTSSRPHSSLNIPCGSGTTSPLVARGGAEPHRSHVGETGSRQLLNSPVCPGLPAASSVTGPGGEHPALYSDEAADSFLPWLFVLPATPATSE